MRSDLIITRIPYGTKEWLDYRTSGIGGSEISTVLGMNKYDTVTRTFYEKIGMVEPRQFDNAKMFFGRYMEDKIAELWKFFDGTETGWIENYKNNKIIRECRNVKGYVVNPSYPWLFASLDRVINKKGGINLITAQPLTTEAVLEIKTLGYWSASMWQDSIPISYLLQIHVYMIILETDYAEIAILQDGNEFRVERYMRDDSLCEKIINISKDFWYKLVLPAKAAYAKRQEAEKAGNVMEMEKWDAKIVEHEPEPDQSAAYESFMSERFLKERDTIEGDMESYNHCTKDKMLLGVSGRIDDERQLIKNILIKKLTRAGSEAIDFGKLGQATYSDRKGAKNKTFSNRVKEKPSEDRIEKEFKKVNWDFQEEE